MKEPAVKNLKDAEPLSPEEFRECLRRGGRCATAAQSEPLSPEEIRSRFAFRMVLTACWGFTALLLFSMTVAAAPPAESARILAMRLDLGYAG
jgi:hypothetical protein